MLDFLMISAKRNGRGVMEIYPKFIMKKSSDLMIRGGDFYAIWIEDNSLWSTDEYDVVKLVDKELDIYAKEHNYDGDVRIRHMWDAESGIIDSWHKYCQRQLRDSYHVLDESIIFANSNVQKEDYASRRLPYSIQEGNIDAYDKLISTLYLPEERKKIEWAIGAVVHGDSKYIQKFLVLYGAAGTGKSTILNIIQKLFEGYYSVFDAKALGSANNQFALESFKSNPLVAIQHDGDLSKIEDNTRLNSLVSHEIMTVNEKFKSTYENKFISFLFMGTNKPVKITDAKSGLIRRLIDVSPSGNRLNSVEYKKVVKQIDFELGAIAYHCQNVFLENPAYYDSYVPIAMMSASNDFYNFILESYVIFKNEDKTTLDIAWTMYKNYCEEAKVTFLLSKRVFKEELKNYFESFKEGASKIDESKIKCDYFGFKTAIFEEMAVEPKAASSDNALVLNSKTSIFDKECSLCPAQYTKEDGTPAHRWSNVKTMLSDIDTHKLHYVKVPENHIVIDFDLQDANGDKVLQKNLEEAAKWPPTYAELSKSGKGVHLHYIYTGDIKLLKTVYAINIEIKIFTGDSSLRRKLTKCNDLPIATISSGLPLKGKKVIDNSVLTTEKGLRTTIIQNLKKQIHPGTKPSIDFIYKILEDAYNSGITYDVTDMREDIATFAANSTHQATYCLGLVGRMKFKSEPKETKVQSNDVKASENKILTFFDVEVFSNVFICCWKYAGDDQKVVKMINPDVELISNLTRHLLVGFNCRRYDNHILYAYMIGYNNKQLFELSQKIIFAEKGSRNSAFFGEAYDISYTDVYDFASKKQSLKKWEIELGIHHQEFAWPWDVELPEEKWEECAEYCANDVIATEAVFNFNSGDWTAREILADLAGLSVNSTTNTLTTKIIFGNNKSPSLIYTDLSTGDSTDGVHSDTNSFPGYTFEYDEKDKKFHNLYLNTDLGLGGYVYARPGMYENVALLDIQSLHPNSAIQLNAFGDYTKNFKMLLDARVAIKHGKYDEAKDIFNNKLDRYLNDESNAKALSQALKIAINSVYGLTSARFENAFKDPRNRNNIVALRGALFMRSLQANLEEIGETVLHIKTDSIKIANATPEIIFYCNQFAKKYGYIFEHEATYEKICLVNDSVYIARYATMEKCNKIYGESYVQSEKDILKENKKHPNQWTPTGTQFQIPYVFKTLFTHEEIVFDDLCETKSVTSGSLYLDFNEQLNDVSSYEIQLEKLKKKKDANLEDLCKLKAIIDGGHAYQFIGRVGRFCPVKSGYNGGWLIRETINANTNEKGWAFATGSKGYRWLESTTVERMNNKIDAINLSYYDALVDDAVANISKFGDIDWLRDDT